MKNLFTQFSSSLSSFGLFSITSTQAPFIIPKFLPDNLVLPPSVLPDFQDFLADVRYHEKQLLQNPSVHLAQELLQHSKKYLYDLLDSNAEQRQILIVDQVTDNISNFITEIIQQHLTNQMDFKQLYISEFEFVKTRLINQMVDSWQEAREKSEFICELLDHFMERKLSIKIGTERSGSKKLAYYHHRKNYVYVDLDAFKYTDERKLFERIIHEIAIHALFANLFTYDYLRQQSVAETELENKVSELLNAPKPHIPTNPYPPYVSDARKQVRTGLEQGVKNLKDFSEILNSETRSLPQIEMLIKFYNTFGYQVKLKDYEQFENVRNEVEKTVEREVRNMLQLLENIKSAYDPLYHMAEKMAFLHEFYPEELLQQVFPDLKNYLNTEVYKRLGEYYQNQDIIYPDYLPETDITFSTI